MRLVRKYLILSHRYMGIALCLLVVMWFATGFVMMYAGGMPRLSPEMRLDRLSAVDLANVKLTPAEAAERARDGQASGGRRGAGRTVLLSVMERPAYRIGARTVFADTGDVMDELTIAQSRTAASRFTRLAEDKIQLMETVEKPDQWTLQSRPFPLYRFSVDDGQGTEIYIQPQTGEVAVMTTSKSRMLAWMGTIPHWLYFTAIRTNQPVWFQFVTWTSGLAAVAGLIGLILAFTQWRKVQPFRLSAAIPYSGWTRWHYITGAVFGLFTVTWAFSGMLSMEPFAWTRADGLEIRRDVFTGGAVDLAQFGRFEPAKWSQATGGRGIKEIEFTRIQDQHYYVVHPAATPEEEKQRERLHQPYYITGRADGTKLLISAKTLEARQGPFTEESLVARLKGAVPDAPIVDTTLLQDYDSYYYSRGRLTPLPVLRVKFGDPAETWAYVDPEMSQLLSTVSKNSRLERWLYNGLHSLDFSFWYNKRPLWDIGMLTLLAGGLISSSLGLMLGVRRLRRGAAAMVKATPERAMPQAAEVSK